MTIRDTVVVLALLLQLAFAGPGHAGDAQPSSNARALLADLRFPADRPLAYVERQRSPMFKRAVESRGRVWRTADGALYMQVETPRQELRCIEAGSLTILRPEQAPPPATVLPAAAFTRIRHQFRLTPQRPGQLLLLTASALLNGDLAWVLQHFELSAETEREPGTAQSLVLQPKDPGTRQGMANITLSIEGDQLRTVAADRGRRGSLSLDFWPLLP